MGESGGGGGEKGERDGEGLKRGEPKPGGNFDLELIYYRLMMARIDYETIK